MAEERKITDPVKDARAVVTMAQELWDSLGPRNQSRRLGMAFKEALSLSEAVARSLEADPTIDGADVEDSGDAAAAHKVVFVRLERKARQSEAGKKMRNVAMYSAALAEFIFTQI